MANESTLRFLLQLILVLWPGYNNVCDSDIAAAPQELLTPHFPNLSYLLKLGSTRRFILKHDL